MIVSAQQAATLLLAHERIVVLAHRKPDGDTMGSSFALCYALQSLGKQARVECEDGYPAHYSFIYGDYTPDDFAPDFVVAADVADTKLLGTLAQKYEHIGLCIDHHKSNGAYAESTLLDVDAPATAEIMYDVIRCLNVQPDQRIADALFTGLCTDTGCFRYPSVTAKTHRCAADLIELGARHGMINKLMFDTKSRGRLMAEKIAMDSLEYHFDGQCALIWLPHSILTDCGVTEEQIDGLANLPVCIDGVKCGILIREHADGLCKISLRTTGGVDGSEICKTLGGGGHVAAAGCSVRGDVATAKAAILQAVGTRIGSAGA